MNNHRVRHALVLLLSVLVLAALCLASDWETISTAPSSSVLIVACVALAAAVRVSISSAVTTTTLDLGPAALALLTSWTAPTLPMFGLWLVGSVIGATWSLRSLPGASRACAGSTVAGAAMLAVDAAMPDVGPASSVVLLGGRGAALAVSFVVYVALRTTMSLLTASLVDHVPYWRVLAGTSWTRVLAILFGQLAVTWGALAILQADEAGLLRSLMGPMAAPTEVLLSLLAFVGITVNLTRSQSLISRETGLADALLTIPWPPVPPTEDQAAAHLRRALRGHTIGVVHPAAGEPVPEEHGRYIVSPVVEGGPEPFRLTVRRSIWQRPFTPLDRHLLEAVSTIAQESLRVNQEVQRIRTISGTDPLTGVLTYPALRSVMEGLRDQSDDTGLMALLLIDVDDFAHVNQAYGREAGDAVLTAVALRLRSAVGPDDTVARFGGDEFAVLMPRLTDREEAERAAWNLEAAANAPVLTDAGLVAVTTTQSVAVTGTGRENLDDLLARTDQRIHAAGTDIPSTPIRELADRPEDAASGPTGALVRAVREDRIGQVYQPIIDRGANRIVGLETLIRYRDPHHGEMSSSFIVAEANRLGLGSALSAHLLRHALEDMDRFRRTAPSLTRLYVKVDAASLADHVFVSEFEDLTAAHPDVEVVLELRQQSLRAIPDPVAGQVEAYAASHGVALALDDAGTEVSEIRALIRFPVETVKLDRRILGGFRDPRTARAVRAIRAACTELGLELVFEGVETPEQIAFLDTLGGYLAQGFAFARPVTAREFRLRVDSMGLELA